MFVGLLLGLGACQRHLPKQSVHNAVSLSLPAMATRTLGVTYERMSVAEPSVSLAAIGGFRKGAAGDYSSRTFALGAEARYWITGAPFRRTTAPRQMVGPYAGFRLAVGRTTTFRDDRDGSIGSMLEFSETAVVGYRVMLFRRIALTYSQGLQARHEFDRGNGLPAWSRFGLTFGATAGGVF